MKFAVLGKTGLKASRIGMGCGGHSRVGISESLDHSVKIIQSAIREGVNLIDTAEQYHTEPAVGQGIKKIERSNIILSTKFSTHKDGRLKTRKEIIQSLDKSLKNLDTDYIDIYHAHGIHPKDYKAICEHVYPVMEDERRKGKIRFIGITELFNRDKDHTMLKQAVVDDIWEVIMVGYNFINYSAEIEILSKTENKGIGVLGMFGIRKALTRWDLFQSALDRMVKEGKLDQELLNEKNIIQELKGNPDIISLPDTGYRFCFEEKRIHCVLSGSGNETHVHENIKSIEREPLSKKIISLLKETFNHLETETGEV